MTRAALVVAAITSLASVAHAAPRNGEPWWRDGDRVCPPGAVMRGDTPPRGGDIACVKRDSGVFHGPRTTWFDACAKAKPCKQGNARIRFQGVYERGIEHGHWIFWHKDGRKGLEGEYFAGKKSGTWQRWDGRGRQSVIEYEDFSKGASPDSAILAALEAASKVGNEDLARELELASKALRAGRASSDGAHASRGADSYSNTIGASASLAGDRNLDVPDVDMGAESFEGGGEGAPPYVRRAIRKATERVGACYGEIRAQHPRLSGEIVARFTIAPSGDVEQIAIVKSTMTEGMNQCVKRALQALRFDPHDGAPVEVISPWRFEAPK